MPEIYIKGLKISPGHPRVVGIISNEDEAKKAEYLGADILEARCDKFDIKDIKEIPKQVERIKQATTKPLIGTIRKTVDGGDWYKFKGNDESRYETFKEIMPLVDIVDIEENSKIKDKLIELTKNHGTKILLSHHNVSQTPKRKEIENLIEKMYKTESDILKLAFLVGDKNDFLNLSGFLIEYMGLDNDKPLSLIPLGYHGRPGRFTFPWLGSCLGYAIPEEKNIHEVSISKLSKTIMSVKNLSKLPLKADSEGYDFFKTLKRYLI